MREAQRDRVVKKTQEISARILAEHPVTRRPGEETRARIGEVQTRSRNNRRRGRGARRARPYNPVTDSRLNSPVSDDIYYGGDYDDNFALKDNYGEQ